MANIVNLDRVSKGYGAAGQLLTDVSLGLDDDALVGIVGLNGAGKSTLLRMLAKSEEPDSGRVTHRRDLRVAALPQTLTLAADATVRDVVLGTAWLGESMGAEHEWAGDAGVRTILAGLGMSYLGLDSPVGPMSGGERRRVALAALLVRDSDLLILDEPTNHLDVAGVDWLARYLLTRRGALVVVTHDRWFLDAVCSATWEVVDQQVHTYEGGYAAWTLTRAERLRVAAAVESRRQNLLRKEIAWLRRGPPARTSKPQFRIDAANALIADVPPVRDKVSLQRLATTRLGKQVYDLEHVFLNAGPKTIFQDLTWQVGPGDRIAILGANGAGKTTLLRLLAGLTHPSSGRLVTGSTVRSAFLSQELTELPSSLRLLEAVEEVAKRVRLGDRELSAAQLAEVFGFTEKRIWTPVGDLSGGERRRLQLLRLLAGEPNVLLLDEPTNDLDTDTLASLEDLLDSWPGTMIVASHDRYLVERVTDTAYGIFGDGRLIHLPGGVDDYLKRVATPLSSSSLSGPPGSGLSGPGSSRSGSTASGSSRSGSSLSDSSLSESGLSGSDLSGSGPSGSGPSGSGRSGPSASTVAVGSSGAAGSSAAASVGGDLSGSVMNAGELRAARKELNRLERQLGKLEDRILRINESLADHGRDYEKLIEFEAQLKAVQSERAAVEEAWLELAEQIPES